MKKNLFNAIVLCSLLSSSLTGCGKKADFTVGISQFVKHSALDAATKGFQDALSEKMSAAGKTIEFDLQYAGEDTAVCSTIASTFVSKNYDLIMANATPALQAAANATSSIPILGTSVTEYGVALGINNFSGVTGFNVSGTSDLAPLESQAQMILDLVPTASRIGILYCSAEANSVYQSNVVKTCLENQSKAVETLTFTDSNDISSVLTGALTRTTNKFDALYVPTDNTAANNAELINQLASQYSMPIIAGEEGICAKCGVATLSISYYNIGRKTGEMAADILLNGADITKMAIQYDANPVKKYNPSIATALGLDSALFDTYTAIE